MLNISGPLDHLEQKETPTDSQTYKFFRILAVGLEVLLWLGVLIGALAKLESWEFSSEILILFFSALSVYYILAAGLLSGARSKWQWVGGIGVGLSFAAVHLGRIFVLESWSGGRGLLIIGFGGLFLTMGLSMFFLATARQKQASTRFYWNVLIRSLIIFVL